MFYLFFFFFSSRRRHTRCGRDWSSDVCSSDLIRFSRDSLYAPATDTTLGVTSPELSWERDGHYFTVYFPELLSQPTDSLIVEKSPWLYMAYIVGILLVFFAFSISVIIRQKRISEVKTDFVNNMTHELKTPISTIGLSSEMLMTSDFTKDPERLKKYAEVIFKENKRL